MGPVATSVKLENDSPCGPKPHLPQFGNFIGDKKNTLPSSGRNLFYCKRYRKTTYYISLLTTAADNLLITKPIELIECESAYM